MLLLVCSARFTYAAATKSPQSDLLERFLRGSADDEAYEGLTSRTSLS